MFGAQLPEAAELENMIGDAELWSAQEIGAPYYEAVFDPILGVFGPLGGLFTS